MLLCQTWQSHLALERRETSTPVHVIMSYPVVALTGSTVIAHWSGHLCLASGTSDLSQCHDGSPTKSWVLCASPSVHVWQREDSQWISILISRPSAPSYKGNWHISVNTMVFKWLDHSKSTKTEHPNTPSKLLQTVRHLTHFPPLSEVTYSDKAAGGGEAEELGS